GAPHLFVALREVEERADARVELLAVGELLARFGILTGVEQLARLGEKLFGSRGIASLAVRRALAQHPRARERDPTKCRSSHESISSDSLYRRNARTSCLFSLFFPTPARLRRLVRGRGRRRRRLSGCRLDGRARSGRHTCRERRRRNGRARSRWRGLGFVNRSRDGVRFRWLGRGGGGHGGRRRRGG